MPFQSEKQRKYLHANHPEIANRWEAKYGLGGIAELNSQLNSLPEYYMNSIPAAQGGRIGYDKGLKVWPKAEIIQSSSTPDKGIDVTERDITYGLEGLLQGDNLYAGGEFQTGNVNVNVQKDGNTVFEDTMSKEDLYNLYVGLGEKEGDRVEVGKNSQGTWTFNIVRSFNHGGFIPAHEAGIYGLEDGGRTGFRRGTSGAPGGGDPGMTSDSSGAGQTHSGGDRGYQNVHQTGAVTQTPGRTPDPAPDPDRGWQTYAIEDKKKTTTTDDKPIESMGYDEFIKFGTGVQDYYKNLLHQKNIKEGKLDFGEQEWQNLIVPGALDLGKNKESESMGFNEFINFGEGLVDQFEDIEGYTADVSQSDIDILGKYAPNQELDLIKMMEKGLNPTITDQEIKDVLQKKITKPTGKFAAQGGIVGLKQGGTIAGGHQIGTPIGNRTGFGNPFGYGDAPADTSSDNRPEGMPAHLSYTAPTQTTTPQPTYQTVHDTGAISQTPYYDPTLPPQLGGPSTGEDAITYARDEFETQKATLENKIQNSIRNKFIGALLGGPLTLGLSDLKTAKNMYDLAQVKKNYINLLENAKTLYKKQGVPEFNPHVDTAIQTINQEILDLTQTRDRPDQGPDGGDGVTGVASITYDDMEDTNRKERASTEANTILEDARNAKRDAYLAAFRQKYLMGDTEKAAHGGRIPGYNTGGLSNLFRLKNV